MRGLIGFASGFFLASAVLIGTPIVLFVGATVPLGALFGSHHLGAQKHTYVCSDGDERQSAQVVSSPRGAYALTLSCQHDQPAGSAAASLDLEHYFILGESMELLPPWDSRFEEAVGPCAYRRNRATAIEVVELAQKHEESEEVADVRRTLLDELGDVEVGDAKWDALWQVYERKTNGILRDLMEPDLQLLRDDPRHDAAVVDLAAALLFPTEVPERLEASAAPFGVARAASDRASGDAEAPALLEYAHVEITASAIEIYSAQFNELDAATPRLVEHLCEIGCTRVQYGYFENGEDDI